MKKYRVVSYLNVFLWILMGWLTIGSISLGCIGLYINLIMGIVFQLIGFYWLAKARIFIAILKDIDRLNFSYRKSKFKKKLNRLVWAETVFNILSILVAAIFLSGMISRMLTERMPVFG